MTDQPHTFAKPGLAIAYPLLLVAELSYVCPLKCPYCSNPTSIVGARRSQELQTDEWTRIFHEAGKLGVLQLALTGGEPLLRKDLEELCSAGRDAGMYSTLVTSALPGLSQRVEALRDAGLDHVQISIQHADPEKSELIGGAKSFQQKLDAAAATRELGMPLTINVVLHRHNLDDVEEIIELAAKLGARRLELANTQYHGWAKVNRQALLPTREQVERGEEIVNRARERYGAKMEILWVLPDMFEDLPKPCMGGWASDAIIIDPNGRALPCQSAATIPDLPVEHVREQSLEQIWFDSESFNKFRGTDWMQDPCSSCPLQRQHIDHGGCRCQALALTGDAAATDPVCHLSPHHAALVAMRDAELAVPVAERPDLVYRTTSRPRA
ncbi:MAG: pyrroloquinoline quinone biosynthesis protein PqqE [Thermoleophilia bacterium]|nr:pyrroloquinoline quinone biosynthesis protein PqqE [Thermoleophilia bacterium]